VCADNVKAALNQDGLLKVTWSVPNQGNDDCGRMSIRSFNQSKTNMKMDVINIPVMSGQRSIQHNNASFVRLRCKFCKSSEFVPIGESNNNTFNLLLEIKTNEKNTMSIR